MQNQTQNPHSRKQFQIDRLAFFSDAVIAIALTLSILEIKIPAFGTNATSAYVFKQYGGAMILHGLELFVAFWTIGNLWMRHHQLFENIVDYNEKMIRVNLIFLFSVMLLPISISFLFSRNEPYYFKMLFYFTNLFFSSATYSLLVYVIFNPKKRLSDLTDPKKLEEVKGNPYWGSIVFLLALILIIFNRSWFWVAFLVIPLAKIVATIQTKRKNRKTSTIYLHNDAASK
jgi:uncharacterized membrane protein